MATLDFVQTNFTRGELSPRSRRRIDFQTFERLLSSLIAAQVIEQQQVGNSIYLKAARE